MDSKQIYEIGYLLIPTISEEKVGEKVSSIKELLEKNGAVFISEEFPKSRTLAYKMAKKTDESHKEVYDKGYFGWIKFELPIEVLALVESALKSDVEIIRHLLIKTVRENTIIPAPVKASAVTPKEETPAKTEEDEKEIDESIDELVIE